VLNINFNSTCNNLYADYIVIGSGPAGQKAAIQAAKLGKTVIVIEKDPYPGGASLNSGTIPSKSLREAIIDLTDFYERSFYGKDRSHKKDFDQRLELPFEYGASMSSGRCSLSSSKRTRSNLSMASPGLIDALSCGSYSMIKTSILYKVRGDSFLIASGSSPRNPSPRSF
jgi:NAD(P) transhydrogenase